MLYLDICPLTLPLTEPKCWSFQSCCCLRVSQPLTVTAGRSVWGPEPAWFILVLESGPVSRLYWGSFLKLTTFDHKNYPPSLVAIVMLVKWGPVRTYWWRDFTLNNSSAVAVGLICSLFLLVNTLTDSVVNSFICAVYHELRTELLVRNGIVMGIIFCF